MIDNFNIKHENLDLNNVYKIYQDKIRKSQLF